MQNLKLSFLLITLFLFSFYFAKAQSKIYAGGGIVLMKIEISNKPINDVSIIPEPIYSYQSPALTFNYEHYFNDRFFISANANYANFKIESTLPDSLAFLVFSGISIIKFNQIAVGGLVNYKIVEKKGHGSINYGIGFNTNYLNNFSSCLDTQGISETEIFELGFVHHLSLNHKNFRLSMQQTIGQKMFGGKKLNLKSTNSILFTLGYVFLF